MRREIQKLLDHATEELKGVSAKVMELSIELDPSPEKGYDDYNQKLVSKWADLSSKEIYLSGAVEALNWVLKLYNH